LTELLKTQELHTFVSKWQRKSQLINWRMKRTIIY